MVRHLSARSRSDGVREPRACAPASLESLKAINDPFIDHAAHCVPPRESSGAHLQHYRVLVRLVVGATPGGLSLELLSYFCRNSLLLHSEISW
jgi:hypothetical protein